VLALLERNGISLCGKKVVVIGRSILVGRPLSIMLGGRGCNATVTLCHSQTPDIAAVCREADILIAAVGRPGFVTADMVKPGAVVVDVGINRREDGSLCGDVDFENVALLASAVTPVPGGVGPMTIAQLLVNTVAAWRARREG
jgi:methylenetetrahydrofolate dehydrogenase (NADP+)/methenyltetrahydrofolate cyclohydrolase